MRRGWQKANWPAKQSRLQTQLVAGVLSEEMTTTRGALTIREVKNADGVGRESIIHRVLDVEP